MTRVLSDPPSRSGRILTQRELDAGLRVLATLRRPQPASVVMSWDNDMQDVLGGLQRARYVETRPAYGGRLPRKSSAPFRPDVLATTELGSEYLDSIQKAQKTATGQSRHHATKKRPGKKTLRQLDREIEQSLASSGQPQLAGLFADPAATKVFAREMRHEIQKKQLSEKTAAALAARPYVVKRLEGGRRELFGRYATEAEARSAADKQRGWIEHGGRVVYGQAPSDRATRRVAHATKSRGGQSWKAIAEDYKRRAKAAREAGGRVKIYPDGSILVVPVEGADEYFFQDWKADEFRGRIERENRGLLDHIRFEDLVLAQSQNW